MLLTEFGKGRRDDVLPVIRNLFAKTEVSRAEVDGKLIINAQ